MQRLKNLLVGVDLLEGDRLVGDHPTPASMEAIKRATWLAKQNGAKVRLMYTLDVPANVQRMILQNGDTHKNLFQQAEDALAKLVKPLTDAGIEADYRVLFGRSWIELIRAVVSDKHDLLMVGTRRLNVVKRMLFGSTGMKLLRNCPCPVWVTLPDQDPTSRSILVAHDLSPVGERALELGAGMAKLYDAPLDVLHAIEENDYGIEFSRLAGSSLAARESAARQQLETQLSQYNLTQSTQIYIVNQSPEEALLAHIEQKKTEVLVMGTVSRTGVAGLLVGNTAERLLPELPCSVVAIKPDDFQSPITP